MIAFSAQSFIVISILPIYSAIIIYLLVRDLRGVFLPYMSKQINYKISTRTHATTLSIVGEFTMLFIIIAELLSAMMIEEISYEFFYLISGVMFLGLLPFIFGFKSRIVHNKLS